MIFNNLVRIDYGKANLTHDKAVPQVAREAAEALAVQALSLHRGGPRAAWRAFWPQPASGPAEFALPRAEPGFLAGVLDHLAGDERLLVAFATDAEASIRGEIGAAARGARPGALGAGRCRDGRVLPRLPRRRRRRQHALSGLRLAAPRCATPSSTRSPSRMSIATPSTPRSRSATIPSLADKPLIVGGGKRGVVTDRLLHRAHFRRPFGDADVRGAQALPARDRDPPNMAKYVEVGRAGAQR